MMAIHNLGKTQTTDTAFLVALGPINLMAGLAAQAVEHLKQADLWRDYL